MAKNNLLTLKGFRDFLPEEMAVRNEVIKRLRVVFEKYGFSEIQTPLLEYQKILLGKYGEEAEKLMYLFKDPGDRDVGLIYDLTVPLARVATTYADLPKPFKRYQIQPVFRAESPQRGRYRQIYQCDVDIVGSSSPISDAETVGVIYDSLKALDFPNFKIRINSRKVLYQNMEKAGIVKNKIPTAVQTIDKLDKKSKEEVEKELSEKGLSVEQIRNVFSEISSAKPDDYLRQTIDYAKKLGVKDNLEFDPTLARGLDYYTGPIFESVVLKPNIGSVTGGGRFDNLLKDLGGVDLPAVGMSVGLDRVSDIIEDLKLWPFIKDYPAQVLVTVFSKELVDESLYTASLLRQKSINVELYEDDETKLDKQLKYADKKKIPWVIIIGPDEAKEGKVVLKNLHSGEQETIDRQDVPSKIK